MASIEFDFDKYWKVWILTRFIMLKERSSIQYKEQSDELNKSTILKNRDRSFLDSLNWIEVSKYHLIFTIKSDVNNG